MNTTTQPRQTPDEAYTVMPFGKHAGRELIEIARRDPSYLAWMRDNLEKPELADAAEIVLRFERGGK